MSDDLRIRLALDLGDALAQVDNLGERLGRAMGAGRNNNATSFFRTFREQAALASQSSLGLGRELDALNRRFGVGSREANTYAQSQLNANRVHQQSLTALRTLAQAYRAGEIELSRYRLEVQRVSNTQNLFANRMNMATPMRAMQADLSGIAREMGSLVGSMFGGLGSTVTASIAPMSNAVSHLMEMRTSLLATGGASGQASSMVGQFSGVVSGLAPVIMGTVAGFALLTAGMGALFARGVQAQAEFQKNQNTLTTLLHVSNKYLDATNKPMGFVENFKQAQAEAQKMGKIFDIEAARISGVERGHLDSLARIAGGQISKATQGNSKQSAYLTTGIASALAPMGLLDEVQMRQESRALFANDIKPGSALAENIVGNQFGGSEKDFIKMRDAAIKAGKGFEFFLGKGEKFGEMKGVLSDFVSASELLSKSYENSLSVMNSATDFLAKTMGETMLPVAQKMVDSVSSALVDSTGNLKESVANMASQVGANVGNFFSSFQPLIKPLVEFGLLAVQMFSQIGNILSPVMVIVSELGAVLIDVLNFGLSVNIQALQIISDLATIFTQVILHSVTAIREWASGFAKAVTDLLGFNDASNQVTQFLQNAWKNVGDTINLFHKITQLMVQNYEAGMSALGDFTSGVVNTLIGLFQTLWGNILNLASSGLQALVGIVGVSTKALIGLLFAPWNLLGLVIGKFFPGIGKVISGGLNNWLSGFSQFGKSVVENIKAAFNGIGKAFGQLFDGIKSGNIEKVKEAFGSFEKLVPASFKGGKINISASAPTFDTKGLMSDLTSSLSGQNNAVQSGINAQVDKLTQSVKSKIPQLGDGLIASGLNSQLKASGSFDRAKQAVSGIPDKKSNVKPPPPPADDKKSGGGKGAKAPSPESLDKKADQEKAGQEALKSAQEEAKQAKESFDNAVALYDKKQEQRDLEKEIFEQRRANANNDLEADQVNHVLDMEKKRIEQLAQTKQITESQKIDMLAGVEAKKIEAKYQDDLNKLKEKGLAVEEAELALQEAKSEAKEKQIKTVTDLQQAEIKSAGMDDEIAAAKSKEAKDKLILEKEKLLKTVEDLKVALINLQDGASDKITKADQNLTLKKDEVVIGTRKAEQEKRQSNESLTQDTADKQALEAQKNGIGDTFRDAGKGLFTDIFSALREGGDNLGQNLLKALTNFTSKITDKLMNNLVDKLFGGGGSGAGGSGFSLGGLFGGGSGGSGGGGFTNNDGNLAIEKLGNGNFGSFDAKTGAFIKDLGTQCGISAREMTGLGGKTKGLGGMFGGLMGGLGGIVKNIGGAVGGLFSGKGFSGFKNIFSGLGGLGKGGGKGGGSPLDMLGGLGGAAGGAGPAGAITAGLSTAFTVGMGIYSFFKKKKEKKKAQQEKEAKEAYERLMEEYERSMKDIQKSIELRLEGVNDQLKDFAKKASRAISDGNYSIGKLDLSVSISQIQNAISLANSSIVEYSQNVAGQMGVLNTQIYQGLAQDRDRQLAVATQQLDAAFRAWRGPWISDEFSNNAVKDIQRMERETIPGIHEQYRKAVKDFSEQQVELAQNSKDQIRDLNDKIADYIKQQKTYIQNFNLEFGKEEAMQAFGSVGGDMFDQVETFSKRVRELLTSGLDPQKVSFVIERQAIKLKKDLETKSKQVFSDYFDSIIGLQEELGNVLNEGRATGLVQKGLDDKIAEIQRKIEAKNKEYQDTVTSEMGTFGNNLTNVNSALEFFTKQLNQNTAQSLIDARTGRNQLDSINVNVSGADKIAAAVQAKLDNLNSLPGALRQMAV